MRVLLVLVLVLVGVTTGGMVVLDEVGWTDEVTDVEEGENVEDDRDDEEEDDDEMMPPPLHSPNCDRHPAAGAQYSGEAPHQ